MHDWQFVVGDRGFRRRLVLGRNSHSPHVLLARQSASFLVTFFAAVIFRLVCVLIFSFLMGWMLPYFLAVLRLGMCGLFYVGVRVDICHYIPFVQTCFQLRLRLVYVLLFVLLFG